MPATTKQRQKARWSAAKNRSSRKWREGPVKEAKTKDLLSEVKRQSQ